MGLGCYKVFGALGPIESVRGCGVCFAQQSKESLKVGVLQGFYRIFVWVYGLILSP